VNRQLILVKHSEPEIREDMPAHEWKLSEEGRQRTERLAGHLIQYHPEIIITSPEPKATETAEILAKRLQLPIQVIEDLREHDRSLVPHLSKGEFEAVVREFFERPGSLVFGSETADQAQERFSLAVDSALSQINNSKIVIVAHGTVISLFVARLTGRPGFQLWSQLGLPSYILLDLPSKTLMVIKNIS
jgi:broad specificity phosphatase PhoE